MKRENEDNYQEDQNMQSDDNQQTHDGNGQDESQDDTNDTNNFNNLNNQDNGNGGPNPPKRLRRNDDEEVRLLIPSKVQILNPPRIHRFFTLITH